VKDPTNGAPNNRNNVVGSMAFSLDGTLLAISMYAAGAVLAPTGVQLWDRRTAQLLATLSIDGGAVAFSPDGRSMAFHGADGDTVEIWSVADRKLSTTVRLAGEPPAGTPAQAGLAFSPDGHTLAVPDNNGVQLWRIG
jgi:WD40 repeat protein